MTRNLAERVHLETNEFGFQVDYNNEITSLYGILMMIGTPYEAVYREGAGLPEGEYILDKISVKKYTDYFPISQYNYPITPQVKLVDAYATMINALLENKSEDYNKLHHLVQQIYFLVSGKKLF